MPSITLHLYRKTLTFSVCNGLTLQKLVFWAVLSKPDLLKTTEGITVQEGHVEFLLEPPKYETEKLHFIDGIWDPDNRIRTPPCFSFYALPPKDLFIKLRDLDRNSTAQLKINTHWMSAMKFGDSLGHSKIWDIALENPIGISSYEVVITTLETDA